MDPIEARGDQYRPRAPGTVETMQFWYGPYVVPPGNDMNRFDLNLPVGEGFVLSIEPRLRYAQDLTTPTHQHAHIHHAHWLRLDPGNDTDNYTGGLTQWLWGTGDEETRADARRQSAADPKGPVYGGYTRPGYVEPVIYMIHNKTSSPMNAYIVLGIVFAHGSPEQLKQATGREHRNTTGVIFGRTFDVPRRPSGPGEFETARDDPDGPIEWVSTMNGTIVGTGGHLHPGGRTVTIENLGPAAGPCPRTRFSKYGGTTLFRSQAVHRTAEPSEDFQMTIPKAGWRAPVRKGDRLRISGAYENRDHAWYAVMSHAGVYVDQQAPPRGRCRPYLVGKEGRKAFHRKAPDVTKGVLNREWRGQPDPVCGSGAGHSAHHVGGACEREEPDTGPGMDTQLVTIQNFAYTPGGRGLPGQLGAPARVKQGQSLTFVNADQEAGIRLHGDDLPLAMQWSLCGELPDRRRALGLRDARLRPGRWRQPDPVRADPVGHAGREVRVLLPHAPVDARGVRGGRMRRAILAGGALAAALGAAAPAAHADERFVAVPVNMYGSNTVTIDPGEQLIFQNLDLSNHDIVSEGKGANGQPLFKTPLIGPGSEALAQGVPALKGGSYPFYCSVHTFMKATLVVTGPPGGGPSPSPPPSSDTTAPGVSVRIVDTKLSQVKKSRKLRVQATMNEPGNVQLIATVKKGKKVITIAKATKAFTKAARANVTMALTKAGQSELRRRSSAAIKLDGHGTDGAGNVGHGSTSRTLRK
jgi:plastocyanin